MTMITYHESDRSRFRSSSSASFIRSAFQPFARLREAWHRRQTERMLEGLDPEIRKDIGWPTTDVNPDRK